jgi:hypothetical protein
MAPGFTPGVVNGEMNHNDPVFGIASSAVNLIDGFGFVAEVSDNESGIIPGFASEPVEFLR